MFTGGSLSHVRYLLTVLTGNREAEQWAYDTYVNSVPDQHASYLLVVCYALGAYDSKLALTRLCRLRVDEIDYRRSVAGKRRDLSAFLWISGRAQ